MGVRWAEAVADEMGLQADIVDLRSLVPLDYEAITNSVKKQTVFLFSMKTRFSAVSEAK